MLKKNVFLERNEYPKTVATAYKVLLRTSHQIRYKRAMKANGRNGIFSNPSKSRGNFFFVQSGNKKGQKSTKNDKKCIADVDGVMHDMVHCYSCQTVGHYSKKCPTSNGTNFVSVGFTFLQNKNTMKKTLILLDTCFMHSVSNNAQLVQDTQLCKTGERLMVAMNRGQKLSNTRPCWKVLKYQFF